jgi:DNA-binding MarR family transcriptional regulator
MASASTDRAGSPTADPSAAAAGDPAEAELAARLRLAVTRMARRLRHQVVGGLTPSQSAAMATVERLGSPSLGELAQAEQVRPPSMTRVVESLVSAGLVERVVDDGDRRFARVRLTAEGRRTQQRARSRKTAYLVRRLERLPESERRALPELVRLLERLVEEP